MILLTELSLPSPLLAASPLIICCMHVHPVSEIQFNVNESEQGLAALAICQLFLWPWQLTQN